MSLFLRSGNSPAIILRPLPVLARRHWLHRLIHPRTRGHDVVAQARQHDAENRRVLHAVPTTSHATLDDLVEEVHRVETDGVVRRIVQVEVFPRHVGKEVPLQHSCEGKALGRVGGILILEDGGTAIFGGEGNAVEEFGDLFRGVDLVIEAVYVDHFGMWLLKVVWESTYKDCSGLEEK